MEIVRFERAEIQLFSGTVFQTETVKELGRNGIMRDVVTYAWVLLDEIDEVYQIKTRDGRNRDDHGNIYRVKHGRGRPELVGKKKLRVALGERLLIVRPAICCESMIGVLEEDLHRAKEITF